MMHGYENWYVTDPLKNRTAINEKIYLFVICVEVIIYLLLYNLHDLPLTDVNIPSVVEKGLRGCMCHLIN